MITFSPIQKLIQETLHQKMRMLDRIPPIEINQPATKDGGVPQENYMNARGVFLRMTSLLTRNNKPIVLMGGELLDNSLISGMDIYGPISGGVKKDNPNLRPIAGVKDVNVEYAGGGMKIGATRKTSISWTCWSWDELQKFKPFFLKHGRVILIEWGWGFNGIDSPVMLNIIKENGEINEDLIKGSDTQKPLQELIPEHILKQKGHYDAVLGTINNFEFSVNESGGVDCTTELVSLGVNTLRNMSSKEVVSGYLTDLPILEPETGFWWTEKDKFLKTQSNDLNPYYSFKNYMGTLEGHLHLNAQNSKGAIAYILGSDKPYCTWGWFEDNVLSRFASQINKDKETVVGEFRSIENVYKDDGSIDEESSEPVQIRVSRDIMPIDFSPKGWFWVDPQKVSTEPKFWKEKNINQSNSQLIQDARVTGTSSTNINEEALRSADKFKNSGYWWLGDFKLMFGPPYVQTEDTEHGRFHGLQSPQNSLNVKWKRTFFKSETSTWNYNDDDHFRAFKNNTSPNGVIRNIYFGHEFLTECFEKSTISEGVESVWSKFSAAYGGIYDFGIEFDDKEGRLMIKDRGFTQSKVETVLENTSKNPNSDVYNNEGVFVFPIWEKTSLVKSQNLSAKIPNRMQIAAMYGNNPIDDGGGQVETTEDWGAIALGRNEKEVEEDENKEQKLLDSLLGSMDHPFRRSKEGNQFTFGNASADEDEALQWKAGNSVNTTDIFEDKLNDGGSLNDDNDTFGLGINEYLETELKTEFTKRMIKATGLADEAAIKAAGLKADKKGLLEHLGLKKFNPKSTADKLKEAISTFKKATTKVSSMKDIYRFATPSRDQLMGYFKNYPKMKIEYRSIMKQRLSTEGTGLLRSTDPLVPIELEIEIDGTGGIFPGNSFHSSYLPKSYMDRMCFQVIGASHKIDSTGWTTTLKGQMRVGRLKPKPMENIRMIEPTKSDGKKDEDEKQEINDDPSAEIDPKLNLLATDLYPDGVEVETAKAVVTKKIKQQPLYLLDESEDAKNFESQKKAEDKKGNNNKGYTQVGKLGDFDVSRGMSNIKLKSTTTSVDDLFKVSLDGVNGYVAPAPVEKSNWTKFSEYMAKDGW
jgi:hypothetical protein